MRWWGWLVDLCLIAACAAVAAMLRQDANWDQLQYHYWYPWQLFNGGFTDPDLYGGRFQNPLAQVPFYLIVNSFTPQIAQAVLGGLAGISVVMVRRIGMRVLPGEGGPLVVISTIGALLGALGAAFRSELGTSYSDILLAGLLLGALLLALREQPLLAGLLAGAAVGLKYTSAPFVLALLVAVLIVRWRAVGWWVLGTAAGWALTGAVWAWSLWRTYDSPVFPFWNTVFASPWYPQENLTDERYGVAGWQQGLRWPWDMATGEARVLDLAVRDARWLLLIGAVALILAAGRRVGRDAWAVLAFTVVGLVTWLAVFGIIRYAIPAEMLAGLLIMLSLALWLTVQEAVAVSLLIAISTAVWTQTAQGRRVDFGSQWFNVEPGAFDRVAPGDVVLVDGQYPSAFLLPGQLPKDVQVHVVQKDFVGTPLQDWLEKELRGERVWVVTGRPPSQVDPAIGTIDYEDCTRIRSNVVDRWLCPLSL